MLKLYVLCENDAIFYLLASDLISHFLSYINHIINIPIVIDNTCVLESNIGLFHFLVHKIYSSPCTRFYLLGCLILFEVKKINKITFIFKHLLALCFSSTLKDGKDRL